MLDEVINKSFTRRKTHKIEPSDIVNMDQTMCHFDMPPSHTNKKGEKSICIATTHAEKKGFTVALAATALGTTLPAVIIFKERGGSLGVRIPSKHESESYCKWLDDC